MSDHNWMRQSIVDILQYLPAFLAHSQQFQATNDADSKEHDTIRTDLQDVLDQLYVNTATWGLDRWEELVGLPTDKNKDIVRRRAAVLNKLQPASSVTEKFLKEIVNTYIANRSCSVKSIPEDYSVEIEYDGGQVNDFHALVNAVRTYIPAHLGFLVNNAMNENPVMAIVRETFDQEELTEEIKLLPNGNAPGYVAIFAIKTIDTDIFPAEFDEKSGGSCYNICCGSVFDEEVLAE